MQTHKLLTGAAACSLLAALPFCVSAQTAPAGGGTAASAQDQADMQALNNQLQALKASYAQEVRRLRELDMQVQALQGRITGRAGTAPQPAQATPSTTVATAEPGTAGSPAEAQRASTMAPTRSLEDALQENHTVFNRKLTIENGITYAWYDRKQLTLNGFLALDAIFLGNIALQDVKSNMLTYDLTARYAVSPRMTLSLDVPYLYRHTTYMQGGAGGSAAALQEEPSHGDGIGDASFSANYKLFSETASRPDTVLTLGVVAPTGRSPYGIAWQTPGVQNANNSNDTNTKFAIPTSQPTGNGLWQGNLALSAVKTLDPAIVFANLGYIHAFPRHFGDIDTNPQTVTPGSVRLGDSYYYDAGVAFAFNERTSLSLSFSDKISAKAALRPTKQAWTKVVGSDANAASFNFGLTYALTPHTTLVTQFGIGLTPDAPNYTVNFKIPYMF